MAHQGNGGKELHLAPAPDVFLYVIGISSRNGAKSFKIFWDIIVCFVLSVKLLPCDVTGQRLKPFSSNQFVFDDSDDR